jgi:phenylpropionate dioxygenase-like ring-hydroxylating dioxygenase large terminal subunit
MEQPSAEAALVGALARGWWPVAIAADLTAPRTATLLGHDLAVHRTADGAVHVTDDMCPHRGASLSRGTVVGDALQCPYHGWRWDGASGACVGIPALGAEGAIPPAARLRTYPAVEHLGVVWTCLSDDPADAFPDPGLPSAADFAGLRVGTIAFEANILVAIENFRDVAHLYFVHGDSINPSSPEVEPLHPRRDGRVVTLERRVEIGATDGFYFAEATVMRYRAVAPYCASVVITEDGSDNAAALFSFVSPLSLSSTRVFIVTAATAGFRGTVDDMLAKERVIFAEDKAILDYLKPASLADALGHQVHSVADAYSLAYRQAFSDWLAEASR